MKKPSLLFLLSPPKLAKVRFCFTISSKIKEKCQISTKFQLQERSNHWCLDAAPTVQVLKVETSRQSVTTHMTDTHLVSSRVSFPLIGSPQRPKQRPGEDQSKNRKATLVLAPMSSEIQKDLFSRASKSILVSTKTIITSQVRVYWAG